MQDIIIPGNLPDFDNEPFLGTFQQFFANNIGKNARIEIMVGLSNLKCVSGIIYSVGLQYVNVYIPQYNHYTLCDISSVKFATIVV